MLDFFMGDNDEWLKNFIIQFSNEEMSCSYPCFNSKQIMKLRGDGFTN